jgi:hypothetical protein
VEDKADWGGTSAGCGESARPAPPRAPMAPPMPLPCWAWAWAWAWTWVWAAPDDAPAPGIVVGAADAGAVPDPAPVDSCSGRVCCDRLLCLLRRPKLGILNSRWRSRLALLHALHLGAHLGALGQPTTGGGELWRREASKG